MAADPRLENISIPPTKEQLSSLHVVPKDELPRHFTRGIDKRVFVNRSVRMDKISWFGFDMDYTLAQYKSPAFEQLTYALALERLIEMGYPRSISKLKHDQSFPIRGLFLDTELGNFVKCDQFGNIISVIHGRKRLKKAKIYQIYPTGQISLAGAIGDRFHAHNTLFSLPEVCLYADLVCHFEDFTPKTPKTTPTKDRGGTGDVGESLRSSIERKALDISYKNLHQDLRSAIDHIHIRGLLKTIVMVDMEKYIQRDDRIALLLGRLREGKKRLFLLTNSEFAYTDKVMSFLLNDVNPSAPDWKEYFDVIIVGAKKPLFFGRGTTLRLVNQETGRLNIGQIDSFEPKKVYNGGSLEIFNELTSAKGTEVLYLGDHIFSDIIVSKKTHGWRNFLVVRELQDELTNLRLNRAKYDKLANLEWLRVETFRGLTSDAADLPDITDLRQAIQKATKDIDLSLNSIFGGLFRSGSKETFFSMQLKRYADLYGASFLNLLNYPLCYHFYSDPLPMPHELAVAAVGSTSSSAEEDPKED